MFSICDYNWNINPFVTGVCYFDLIWNSVISIFRKKIVAGSGRNLHRLAKNQLVQVSLRMGRRWGELLSKHRIQAYERSSWKVCLFYAFIDVFLEAVGRFNIYKQNCSIVDCLLYGELMLVAARKKENKKIKNVLKL